MSWGWEKSWMQRTSGNENERTRSKMQGFWKTRRIGPVKILQDRLVRHTLLEDNYIGLTGRQTYIYNIIYIYIVFLIHGILKHTQTIILIFYINASSYATGLDGANGEASGSADTGQHDSTAGQKIRQTYIYIYIYQIFNNKVTKICIKHIKSPVDKNTLSPSGDHGTEDDKKTSVLQADVAAAGDTGHSCTQTLYIYIYIKSKS